MGQVDLVNMHEDSNTIAPYTIVNGEKIYLTTQDEIFLNSQCLFIEYVDIIRSPYYIFLYMMMLNPENFKKAFKVERISGFDIPSLGEWYLHRKYQNPLKELLRDEILDQMNDEDIDIFMNKQILDIPDFIKYSPELNFVEISRVIVNHQKGIVKKVIVWYPYENDEIAKDVERLFDDKVEFRTGELYDVLDDIPKDSTYVFSDIMNIEVLLEKGRLNLSSILIPTEYRYNYTEDDIFKIDYEKYLKESLFKLNFFNASVKPIPLTEDEI